MIEEIQPNLFRNEIPLPNNPLKYTNSYVIRAADRSLIIDTGLNRLECLEAMEAGLRELDLDYVAEDFLERGILTADEEVASHAAIREGSKS